MFDYPTPDRVSDWIDDHIDGDVYWQLVRANETSYNMIRDKFDRLDSIGLGPNWVDHLIDRM